MFAQGSYISFPTSSLCTYLVAFIKELCATNFYDVLSSGSDRPRPLHSKQTQHGHYMCVSSPVMSPERYEQRVRPGKHRQAASYTTVAAVVVAGGTTFNTLIELIF